MKIIGFSSGAVGCDANVDRMVKAIMDKSGHESEFVKLTDLSYSGCKGCVWLCAKPQVCKLADDLLPYYEKIKEADAVVVGSPIYFDSINASTMTLSGLRGFFKSRFSTSCTTVQTSCRVSDVADTNTAASADSMKKWEKPPLQQRSRLKCSRLGRTTPRPSLPSRPLQRS
ncbi:MAG: flavodoxin family protein [Planctomycetota bacterium]